MKILQLGQSGRDVVVWQRFLEQAGYAPETPMLYGEFDDATEEATRTFQEARGLMATGVADVETLENARQIGLGMVDDLTPRGFGAVRAVLIGILFIFLCFLSSLLIDPSPWQRHQGGTGKPACPGWFC